MRHCPAAVALQGIAVVPTQVWHVCQFLHPFDFPSCLYAGNTLQLRAASV